MLVIGITGGIGSGKSAASKFFFKLGITIVDADIVARDVVKPHTSIGEQTLSSIAKHFGQQILFEDGNLDRRALRQRVFKDQNEKRWLEELLHPLIEQEISKQINLSKSKYTVLSSPLLLETLQSDMVHRILLIDTPEQLQISRTVARDNESEEGAKAIIAEQMERSERLQKADDVISNEQSLEHLEREVLKYHHLYSQLAAAKTNE